MSSRRSPIRAYAEQREAARRLALETLSGTADIAPCSAVGMHVGVLLGLERDGLVRQLPGRDRVGDRRFAITDAGRAMLERAP